MMGKYIDPHCRQTEEMLRLVIQYKQNHVIKTVYRCMHVQLMVLECV